MYRGVCVCVCVIGVSSKELMLPPATSHQSIRVDYSTTATHLLSGLGVGVIHLGLQDLSWLHSLKPSPSSNVLSKILTLTSFTETTSSWEAVADLQIPQVAEQK